MGSTIEVESFSNSDELNYERAAVIMNHISRVISTHLTLQQTLHMNSELLCSLNS